MSAGARTLLRTHCRICGRPLGPDRIGAGLVYCDQCGAKADLHDSCCRICGRPLNRPPLLWFDVSIVRPATSTPLISSEPISVELPQTPEAPSVALSSIAASDNAVTKEFATEKGKQFLADYHELQMCLSTPTEPSTPQMQQEVVVSSRSLSVRWLPMKPAAPVSKTSDKV